MKVLLTSDWYPPVVNGVVTSILTLRDQLAARGHHVRTLTLAPQSRSTRDEFGYRLASVGAGAIYTDARVGMPPSRKILDEVHAWGPDVVHSQAEFSTFAWARRIAADTGAPHVHTYHTMYEDYTHYFSPSRRLGRLAAERFSRAILARTDRVVVPTRKVADLLAGYDVDTPVHVVPTGIDVDTLRPAAGDAERTAQRAAIRASLGVRDEELLLVYVGRLAREKELDRVMDLLAEFRQGQRGPAGAPLPRLLVVGDGPERDALVAHARRLALGDAVTFVGAVPREDVGRWYVAGDVFVSGSRSETQGLTYGEAMACGLPILCRADPCLDSLLGVGRDARPGGWQYADGREFLAVLESLVTDCALRTDAGAAARELAIAECSAESFGARIEGVYEQALLHRPRHLAPPRRRTPLPTMSTLPAMPGPAGVLVGAGAPGVAWGAM